MADFDPAYLERLGRSSGVVGLCRSIADRVASIATSTAPVDTGEYVDSIHVEIVPRTDRDAAIVEAADPKALIIEAKYGILSRALQGVGGE